jgi:hypothetical protein
MMERTRTRASALALTLGLTMMLVVGCAQDTSPDSAVPGGAPAGGDMSTGTSVAPVEATPVGGDEHGAPSASADGKLSEDEIAEVNKLPDEADRAAALAQMVCPIGEDIDTKKPNHLGSMGMPVKKVVDGKAYFLCCKGCEADFDKDPQAAIAKLAKK